MKEVEVAARRENILGEGVCWEPRRGRVYWVDIKAVGWSGSSPRAGRKAPGRWTSSPAR
jgi:sugar lactone lactonase YvrE